MLAFCLVLASVANGPGPAGDSVALLAPGFVGTNWGLLTVRPVPMPELARPTSVIVRVAGSSVNPVDWKLIQQRLFPGLPAGFPAKLGMDVAGVVVRVGPNCTRLRPGDEVWADLADDGLGGYATYALADESHLGLKPAGLSWPGAAVLPLVSMTTLASLKAAGAPWRATAPVVMVLGGSGGCGFTGIQMAKAFGASRVLTTTSADNFDFVRGLGADAAFDYRTQDWTELVPAGSVDVVYDTVGAPGSAQKAMRPLRAGGYFITIAGDVAPSPKPNVTQRFIHNWPKNATALDEIKALVDAGQLKPAVQASYALADVPAAFAVSAQGQVVGKLFINATNRSRPAAAPAPALGAGS